MQHILINRMKIVAISQYFGSRKLWWIDATRNSFVETTLVDWLLYTANQLKKNLLADKMLVDWFLTAKSTKFSTIKVLCYMVDLLCKKSDFGSETNKSIIAIVILFKEQPEAKVMIANK